MTHNQIQARKNDCKSPRGLLKKIKLFKGTPKKFDFSENSNVNAAGYPKVQNLFFHTIKPFSQSNIKPWSVPCASTLESAKTEI